MTNEYVYPIRLSSKLNRELDEIMGKLNCSKADAMREAISFFHEHVRSMEVIKLRKIPKERARKEIMKFIESKPKIYTDEIADALHLDISFVDEILTELWQDDRIEKLD